MRTHPGSRRSGWLPLCAALAAAAALTPGAAAAAPSADGQGYPGTAAWCDGTETAVAYGRTARALVAICVDRDGDLRYRGMRLSDEASITMVAGRTSDGTIVATNDGVTYAVSPTMLLVSEGDTVLYRDAWVEFREPRFPGSRAPATTVRTTTVTPQPEG